jgi:hypothetical protein
MMVRRHRAFHREVSIFGLSRSNISFRQVRSGHRYTTKHDMKADNYQELLQQR